MWNMLKFTIKSLNNRKHFVAATVQSGLLLQALKLGAIAPWDHDIDLNIAFSNCGQQHQIQRVGQGKDVREGCPNFLPAMERAVEYLRATGDVGVPAGFGEKDWFTNSNRGWANISKWCSCCGF